MARYTEKQRETAYRIYITDCYFLQGQNKVPSVRFHDLLYPPMEYTEEDGDEIVQELIKKLDLKFE